MEMKGQQKIQKGTAENVTINKPYWSFNIVILSTASGSVMTRENSANNSGDSFYDGYGIHKTKSNCMDYKTALPTEPFITNRIILQYQKIYIPISLSSLRKSNVLRN